MVHNGQDEMVTTPETIPISALGNIKITATNMILSTTDCDEPCNAIVTITWKNSGNSSATFRPTIKINGATSELGIDITFSKNHTTTQVFNLTNLMEGTYIICPYPN